MTQIFFGIGGGSDLHSAQLVAESMRAEDYVVFCSLQPMLRSGGDVNVNATASKYASLWEVEYVPDIDVPIFRHKQKERVYGVLVPSSEHYETYEKCLTRLRALVMSLQASDTSVTAVDTGGDCLRDFVPLMGTNDISYAFGGSLDTRDKDALKMIADVFPNQKAIRTFVLGPGSDGETQNRVIEKTTLELGRNYSIQSAIGSVSLVKIGDMKEFAPFFAKVPEWVNPAPGTTISNIRRGMEAWSQSGSLYIPIQRRNTIVLDRMGTVFMRTYWVLDIVLKSNSANSTVAVAY